MILTSHVRVDHYLVYDTIIVSHRFQKSSVETLSGPHRAPTIRYYVNGGNSVIL